MDYPLAKSIYIKTKFIGRVTVACIIFLLIFSWASFSAADNLKIVPAISIHQVKKLLNSSDVVIIDVRKYRNWWRSSKKILSAVRENPSNVGLWSQKYPKNKMLIFYWAWKYGKTSARVARYFLQKGFSKVFTIEGGWSKWQHAGYPVEKK